ncbi:hypothetical protein [Pseudolabrys sp.]|uniref:hypothetical protein n=1 Tax=Pseudolabrys sp. TaxID=1960880 RepID=UPI003D0FFFC9
MLQVTIQMRVDFDAEKREDKNQLVIAAARTAAKTLIANVALLADKRKPQVSLQVGDMFTADESIEIFDGTE